MNLNEYDRVYLRHPLDEYALPAGATGTVVVVYQNPAGYEIEFCDGDGVPIALVSLARGEADEVVGRLDSPAG